MVPRLDPWARAVAVHWADDEPTGGPWWRIAKNDPRPDLDAHYEGEGDGVAATASFSKAHKAFLLGGMETVYTTREDAQAAMAAMPLDEFGLTIYRLIEAEPPTATTEPIDPLLVPLSDAQWDYQGDGRDGFLPYFWKLGRELDEITPDPNCPPEDYFTIGNWASEAHAVSYRDWQLSISSPSNSWTLSVRSDPLDATGTDSYCIPG